jgi:hypothetical protein
MKCVWCDDVYAKKFFECGVCDSVFCSLQCLRLHLKAMSDAISKEIGDR